MKKLNSVFILFFTTLFFVSCSSGDNNVEAEAQLEQVLVQKTSWIFNHYEMINIINAGNSNLTQIQIESDMNAQLSGFTLIFNEDRTGETRIEGEESENWTWSIENGSDLKILYAGNFSDVYSNLSIVNGQLKMEAESVTYDSVANFEVRHYGSLFFE